MNPIGNASALNWSAAIGGNGVAAATHATDAHATDARQATQATPVTRAAQSGDAGQAAGFPMRYSMRHPAMVHAMMSIYQRKRIVAAKPPPSPAPPPRQTVRRRAPTVAAPDLKAGWIGELDLTSFGDIDFLRECGETLADSASLDQRLAAAHRCFAPELSRNRSALSLEGLNGLSRSLFFQRLMPGLGLGRLPVGGLDPVFAQYLFQRWFLSLASPPAGDGNGGFNAFPLQERLLALTHALPASMAICAGGSRQAAPLPVDILRDALAAQFLREFPHRPPALQRWVTAALIDVFEPTLTRPDLPPQLRYGSLEWTLLAIGINLTGAGHWNYSHQELVGLALAANVFDASQGGVVEVDADIVADANPGLQANADARHIQTDAHAFSRAAIGPVLRMAHAEGAIDLRNNGADGDADADADTAAMLQTAIALFGARMDDRRRSASIGSFFEALPTRRDVAMTMLRERGLDPLQQFRIVKPKGHGRGLLGSVQKVLQCLDFDASYPLVEFFMSDCLSQLLMHGQLAPAYANQLHSALSRRSHALLNQRFNKEFNRAFNALSDGVFAEVLGASLLTMASRDRHFWHCGRPSWVRIPKVDILTRIPSRASLGATGAGRPIVSKVKNYEATGGLFVQLTLLENGVAETRDYWVTLEPLEAARFDGDMTRILAGKLDRFFQADNPGGESLLSLNLQQPIAYRQIDRDNASEPALASLTSLQVVGRQLLLPRRAQAREMAFQLTGPEQSREHLYQSLLDLLPLRACIQSVSDERFYHAAFFCATDVLSLIPMLRAGGQLIGQAARTSVAVPAAQGRKLAISLLTGVVERDIAPRVVASTLRVGKPLLDLAKQTGRWLNPVDGMASGLSWILTLAGRGGLQLLERLRRAPILHRLVADVERNMARQRLFYREDGFWRATPGAVLTQPNGQRQLQVQGTTYVLANIGKHNDVLTIRQSGHSHLVNPESGLAIRPIPDGKLPLDRSASPAGSGASGASDMAPASATAPGKQSLCRIRRGNPESIVESRGCNTIERAPAFGEGFYRLLPEDGFYGVQARVQRQNSGQRTFELVSVDLGNMAVASYSMPQAARQRKQAQPVSNVRYFVFQERVWTAENHRLTATKILCPFPDRIQATITGSSGMATGEGALGGGPHFLAFDIKLPAIPGDPRIYYNKFVVPYGNYPGKKERCMGMIELPDLLAYKFQLKGGWLAPQKPGMRVVLEKADDEEFRGFEQYRRINLSVRGIDDLFDPDSLHQMKNAGIETQRRFEIVFRRTKELVGLAQRALEMRSSAAYRVLQQFMPPHWTIARQDAFIAALRDNLDDIRSALPIVWKSRYEVIGFGRAKRDHTSAGPLTLALPLIGDGDTFARAEALSGSMMVDMDFPFVNKALIYFDMDHFNQAWVDALASDLAHELTHVRLNSRDTISADSNIMLYPRTSLFERNGIDIEPLLSLIEQTGIDSVDHASTFEHLIMALAYTQSADTRPLLKNLLNGRKSYALREDRPKPCGDSCTVLR